MREEELPDLPFNREAPDYPRRPDDDMCVEPPAAAGYLLEFRFPDEMF